MGKANTSKLRLRDANCFMDRLYDALKPMSIEERFKIAAVLACERPTVNQGKTHRTIGTEANQGAFVGRRKQEPVESIYWSLVGKIATHIFRL